MKKENELKPSSEKLVVWHCSNCMVEKIKNLDMQKRITFV